MEEISTLITVVIPCKNEEAYIYNTLKALSQQKNAGGLRVIVSDAGSSDGTISEIERARSVLALDIDVIEGGAVSVGRNRGAMLVKTPYVLFIDADAVLLDPNTIEKTCSLLMSGNTKLVTCTTVNTSNDVRARIAYRLFSFFRDHMMREPFAQGTYMAMSVGDFFSKGMFDETVTQSEDFLLTRKFPMSKFVVLKDRITQDDRRFKKMGYFGFTKLVIANYLKRNNINHFRRDVGYW